VDYTTEFTCIEWCAGYSGICLGLKRAIPTLRTIAYGEIEAFAIANLVAKMEAGLLDPAPIWTDIKTFPCEEFRDRVGILVAGYPCQPFSAAGKRKGKQDPRHLWPYIADAIRAIRPRLVFFENVDGHISMGLQQVLEDLEERGYETAWGVFSASEVGAPHQRKRVFILGHPQGAGLTSILHRPGEEQFGGAGSGNAGELAYTDTRGSVRGNEAETDKRGQVAQCAASGEDRSNWPAGPREKPKPWEPPRAETKETFESSLGRNSDGCSRWLVYAVLCVSCDNRVDELRLLGNGVVPAVAEKAFSTLFSEIANSK